MKIKRWNKINVTYPFQSFLVITTKIMNMYGHTWAMKIFSSTLSPFCVLLWKTSLLLPLRRIDQSLPGLPKTPCILIYHKISEQHVALVAFITTSLPPPGSYELPEKKKFISYLWIINTWYSTGTIHVFNIEWINDFNIGKQFNLEQVFFYTTLSKYDRPIGWKRK